jgi:hypothetical protein
VVVLLQQRDVEARAPQPPGHRQPADARADDDGACLEIAAAALLWR